jgi:hypothetical protein
VLCGNAEWSANILALDIRGALLIMDEYNLVGRRIPRTKPGEEVPQTPLPPIAELFGDDNLIQELPLDEEVGPSGDLTQGK